MFDRVRNYLLQPSEVNTALAPRPTHTRRMPAPDYFTIFKRDPESWRFVHQQAWEQGDLLVAQGANVFRPGRDMTSVCLNLLAQLTPGWNPLAYRVFSDVQPDRKLAGFTWVFKIPQAVVDDTDETSPSNIDIPAAFSNPAVLGQQGGMFTLRGSVPPFYKARDLHNLAYAEIKGSTDHVELHPWALSSLTVTPVYKFQEVPDPSQGLNETRLRKVGELPNLLCFNGMLQDTKDLLKAMDQRFNQNRDDVVEQLRERRRRLFQEVGQVTKEINSFSDRNANPMRQKLREMRGRVGFPDRELLSARELRALPNPEDYK